MHRILTERSTAVELLINEADVACVPDSAFGARGLYAPIFRVLAGDA